MVMPLALMADAALLSEDVMGTPSGGPSGRS
jgi:hypothetical protein